MNVYRYQFKQCLSLLYVRNIFCLLGLSVFFATSKLCAAPPQPGCYPRQELKFDAIDVVGQENLKRRSIVKSPRSSLGSGSTLQGSTCKHWGGGEYFVHVWFRKCGECSVPSLVYFRSFSFLSRKTQ